MDSNIWSKAGVAWLAVNRTTFRFVLIICLIVLGAFSWPDPGAMAKTLKIAVPDDLISIDPARVHRHRVSDIIQGLLYQTLLEVDSQGNYSFGLASSFRARDELTWEFTIHSQDGQRSSELAADLARHFRRIATRDGLSGFPSPARERFVAVTNVTAEGELLVFHLAEPWPGLPSVLAKEPAPQLTGRGTLVSTGAFELERWDHGNRVILKRKKPSSTGEFNRIWFEVVPSAQARLNQLKSGAVDIAMDLPVGSIDQLRSNAKVKLEMIPTGRVHFVELNVTRPPFNDVQLRRALNLAIDVDGLRPWTRGEAPSIATIFPPGAIGYEKSVVPFGYDHIRAKELMSRSGYPNGFEFELDVLASRLTTAQQIQLMLRQVGVDVVLRVWNDVKAWQEVVRSGSRYAWLIDWESASNDPRDVAWDKLHGQGEHNYGGYSSAAFDTLLETAERTYDPMLRLEHYRTAQRFLRQEAPYLFGYVDVMIFGVASDLEWKPGGENGLALDKVRRPD